jgi:hypothetical protein
MSDTTARASRYLGRLINMTSDVHETVDAILDKAESDAALLKHIESGDVAMPNGFSDRLMQCYQQCRTALQDQDVGEHWIDTLERMAAALIEANAKIAELKEELAETKAFAVGASMRSNHKSIQITSPSQMVCVQCGQPGHGYQDCPVVIRRQRLRNEPF